MRRELQDRLEGLKRAYPEMPLSSELNGLLDLQESVFWAYANDIDVFKQLIEIGEQIQPIESWIVQAVEHFRMQAAYLVDRLDQACRAYMDNPPIEQLDRADDFTTSYNELKALLKDEMPDSEWMNASLDARAWLYYIRPFIQDRNYVALATLIDNHDATMQKMAYYLYAASLYGDAATLEAVYNKYEQVSPYDIGEDLREIDETVLEMLCQQESVDGVRRYLNDFRIGEFELGHQYEFDGDDADTGIPNFMSENANKYAENSAYLVIFDLLFQNEKLVNGLFLGRDVAEDVIKQATTNTMAIILDHLRPNGAVGSEEAYHTWGGYFLANAAIHHKHSTAKMMFEQHREMVVHCLNHPREYSVELDQYWVYTDTLPLENPLSIKDAAIVARNSVMLEQIMKVADRDSLERQIIRDFREHPIFSINALITQYVADSQNKAGQSVWNMIFSLSENVRRSLQEAIESAIQSTGQSFQIARHQVVFCDGVFKSMDLSSMIERVDALRVEFITLNNPRPNTLLFQLILGKSIQFQKWAVAHLQVSCNAFVSVFMRSKALRKVQLYKNVLNLDEVYKRILPLEMKAMIFGYLLRDALLCYQDPFGRSLYKHSYKMALAICSVTERNFNPESSARSIFYRTSDTYMQAIAHSGEKPMNTWSHAICG